MATLIEWFDGNQVQRGTLKKEDKAKLQVVSLTGRTVAVKQGRFCLRHETKEDAAAFFAGVDAEAAGVDPELLHGAVEGRPAATLGELAAAWFSSKAPSTRELSVTLAACAAGAPWFSVGASGAVQVATAERIASWRREQAAGERLAAEREQLREILRRAASAGSGAGPAGGGAAGGGAGPAGGEAAGEDSRARWAPGRSQYPDAPGEELDRIAEVVRERLGELPAALNGFAFSIDDETTEEIDDALSAETLAGGRFRVGVHIAAPGAFIAEESRTHATAAARGTTVYQPDLKWTMLPKPVIALFSLRAGRAVPAVSTYYTFDAETFELVETSVRLDAVTPAANLSYTQVEGAMEGGFIPGLDRLDEYPAGVRAWLAKDPRELPWTRAAGLPEGAAAAAELLVPLARRLFAGRVREGAPLISRREYKIRVSAEGEVEITERQRNSLAEGMVSELMILTNNRCAALLAGAGLPAIYRTQRLLGPGGAGGSADGGRGRGAGAEAGTPNQGAAPRARAALTVNPHEHAGLGASFYCWATSPLRRYADLINQRQLGALVRGHLPAFRDESALLKRAKTMEFQSKAAFSHEQRMARYWTLKHLEARPGAAWPVTVERQDRNVRLTADTLPLTIILSPEEVSVPDGPALFTPERFDFYDLTVTGRFN